MSLAGASVRVLREYERGVVFRFGRLVAQKGPGLVLLMPIADRMVRVTLRTITHTIPPQDVITRDNVPARVDAVAYFRVVDADASVVDIEDYLRATSEIAKTTLRSVLGKAELDTLLSERERLNEDLQRIIDEQTEPWGIKVVTVEIKDVGIPQDMQRAMARQAEAERDRRAKVINAEAEFQAAARLAEAADLLSGNPAAMQLRYLQTLAEVGKGEGSTVLLPLPLDVIGSVVRGAGSQRARQRDGCRSRRPTVLTDFSVRRKDPSMLAQARPASERTPRAASDRTAPLIVGFDGSTSAIAAVAWAAASGGPIIVVRVLQPVPAGVDRRPIEQDDASLVFGGHARYAARRLAKCTWRAELVEASSPSAGLAAAARRHEATAIVVGAPGRRHHSGVVGTEPHQLLSRADVPVVVIPPQVGARLLHESGGRSE